MKVKIGLLVVVIVVLLLGTVVVARSNELGQAGEQAAGGEGYRLTTLKWQASGTASGGGYRLLEPAAPALRGSGCCCTYLPCATRNR
jgi:hypothetical protein